MTSHKEPLTITITASPGELRHLAAMCEARARSVRLGDTCFVDFLAHTQDYIVKLNFDQTKTEGSPNYKP